jgi:aryl-alcohol dehydrogenase-like predicted oxidoreductase
MTEKIILGTVQFGYDYGINNQTGKINGQEVEDILKLSFDLGIKKLDTSFGYGESETVIGYVLNKYNLDFKIISKYLQNAGKVRDVFEKSLAFLQVDCLYGYLVHHFNAYKDNPLIWNDFVALKESGKIEKIGFSIYSPAELNYLLDKNISFDIVQFPYNIFDRQFTPYLEELKARKVEIHVRSVFLQGLFFKDIKSLSPLFYPLKPYLLELQSYCANKNVNIASLSLQYVLQNSLIDNVLIGVDSIEQLRKNIETIKKGCNFEDIDFVNSIIVKEKELLNPVNWN